MTTQYGREGIPQARTSEKQNEARANGAAVPGLIEDIALAAAKIYYLTAAGSGPRQRPSTMES